jgi:hypothetical protein
LLSGFLARGERGDLEQHKPLYTHTHNELSE